MQTELLSPAGSLEAAYAAFYYGADAVYLGLRAFSARADAVNFSPEELDEITAYAHTHNKKVYVALNTLLQENELPLLMKQLDICAKCNVDALIVQDLGVARIIRHNYPQLTLHASTQMAVHHLSGALALKKRGFSRVVLARELTLNEINEIKAKSGLEIEVFIHGALCYSYSGLCAFSSLTTGRSANRGKCVYACRGLYRQGTEKKHLFSMKDLALENQVRHLKGLSLKIEGRKKNALYVAAVTDYYRRILDTGKADARLSDNLKQIFARPWTKLHFKGKNKNVIDSEFISHRGLKIGEALGVIDGKLLFCPTKTVERYDGIQLDLPGFEKPFGFSAESLFAGHKSVFQIAAGQKASVLLPPKTPHIPKGTAVYLASSSRVKSAYPYDKPKSGLYKNRTPITVDVYLDKTGISAISGETGVTESAALSTAQNVEKTTDAVKSAFQKTHDTAFFVQTLNIHNPAALFAPASLLNQIRRKLFEKLSAENKAVSLPLPPVHLKKSPFVETKKILKTDDVNLLKEVDLTPFFEVIVVINKNASPADFAFLPSEKVRLALPVINRNETLKPVISKLIEAGFSKWQVGNIGGFGLLPAGLDISTDDTLPVLNTQSLAELFEIGATRVAFSVEDTKENISKLLNSDSRTELVIYQDTPLFISADCIRENECAVCTRARQEWEIADVKNNKYKVISENCLTTVLKNEPYYIGHLLNGLNVPFIRIDFCHRHYSSAEVRALLKTVLSGGKLKRFYSGNFDKSFA